MSSPTSTLDAPLSDTSLSAYGTARSTIEGTPLRPDELHKIDAYWRASLYLCMGMLYLKANPLLREPLSLEHTKPRLLGHWGSDAGQCFTYIHFNRLIKKYDLNAIYISGPGHGAPAVLSQAYLEGTYSEVYPDKSEDLAGMQRFFKQFSFPGGIGSHATPETPGSIHEGGELGYSLSHAYGTVYDNPDLITLVMVGDGEAETGPLATSWHSNKFLNPITDGAVLPVLHLNGYKINNPTILARISREELTGLFTGYGYTPYFVEGSDPPSMHQAMAATLEHCVLEIRKVQEEARRTGQAFRPRWPMIILRSPKGWTAPREVDGHYLEGFWRAHQIPLPDIATDTRQLQTLEEWMRSYRPEELFDDGGCLVPELKALAPKGAPANERKPGRQWRPVAQTARHARLPPIRRRGRETRRDLGRERARPRQFPARGHAAEHAELPRVRARRDAVQPAAGALRSHQESMAGGLLSGGCRRRQPRPERPRHGDAQRAHGGRVAGGLRSERPARPSQQLRVVHSRHRLDGQPARQVARKVQRTAVAGRGVVAQPADHRAGLAPGPQRLHAPGPWLPRCGRQ